MSAGAVPCLAACMTVLGRIQNTSCPCIDLSRLSRQHRRAGGRAGGQAGRQACLIEGLDGTKLQVSQPVEASLFTMLGRVRPLTALACTEVDQPEACFREQALV